MESVTQTQARARRYERIHNLLFVVESVYTCGLLAAFLLTGASEMLADAAHALVANEWGATAIFGAVVVIGAKLLFLPLSFYDGYLLEHRFGLSNERLSGWVLDELKAVALSLVLGLPVLEVVYFLLRWVENWWWVAAGVFFLLFGVGVSALFPVLVLPLFYKLQPLDNESLNAQLVVLAQRVGAKVIGVYRMGLSEKTKKANAAFAGLGATKRIILGDTLLNEFTPDEIEAVMAHEMAHYRHADVWRLIGWGALTTFAGLWVANHAVRAGLETFGFTAVSDLGAFPLLALALFLFSLLTMPLTNAFARWREREADRTALELTNNPAAFISAMHKLAAQNLADLAPHPVVEFLLHDHPSLRRRITWAEQWRAS